MGGVHQQFPELAEDLRKSGYIKKLVVGEEQFAKHGMNRNHSNANGLANPRDGHVYIRRHGTLKSPDDQSKLWESDSVRYFQADPAQAALALFIHEAAHQYYFNDPELRDNSRLKTLFAKALGSDAADPLEYFAESFTAAHIHPDVLDERDPEMGDFIRKFLARKGLSQP